MMEQNTKKSPNYAGPERRMYKRIVKNFIANVRPKPMEGGDGTSWNMVTIKNLGAGGALFNYDRELDIDSLIEMKINFPMAPSPINCVGKIVRTEKKAANSIIAIAAMFTDIEDSFKETINKAAENFYAKRPGMID